MELTHGGEDRPWAVCTEGILWEVGVWGTVGQGDRERATGPAQGRDTRSMD